MECDDGLLPFLRFQKLERDLTVHESIFCEYGRAERMLENVIRRLDVRIPVGEVGPETMPWQILDGGATETGAQHVIKTVAIVGA